MIRSLTCVVDNAALPHSNLRAEHGLAFWIESDAGPILLDTGQSGGALRHNLDVLGLRPQKLKALAISHAHYDHTGGLMTLVEMLPANIPLYANADLLRPRFAQRKSGYDSVGLPVDVAWLSVHFEVHLDDAPQAIVPGVWTTGAIAVRPHPLGGNNHLLVETAGRYVPDAYLDDLSLVLDLGQSLLLLCGCCHAGLLNTLAHVQRTFGKPIVAIVGGTHLRSADESTLNTITNTLASWGTIRRIYLNHCSGTQAQQVLRQRFGADVVRPCPAGTMIDLEADL